MSNDNSPNNSNQPSNDMGPRNRRGSVTSAAFTNLFQRSNSTSTGTSVFPSAMSTVVNGDQRRRLSISTLGLAGTSPTTTNAFNMRRASMSTNNSDSIDESAVDEDDTSANPRTVPNTPFSRRMSFGATAARRTGGNSPGSGNGRPSAQSTGAPSIQRRGTYGAPPTPPHSGASSASSSWKQPVPAKASKQDRSRAGSDLLSPAGPDQGFNWSEQLRSRAESAVAAGPRPSFAFGMSSSPPRAGSSIPSSHDRAKSVSDMPVPPAQAPKPRSPPRDTRPKPDHFQERILKGDFYMD